MTTVAPLDLLTGTVDALPFTIDTVGDKVEWTAVALDQMDGWGSLDVWNYGPLDSLSLEVKVTGGSAATSVSATAAPTKMRSIAASVSVAVTAQSDAARVQSISASVNAVSTGTSAFVRVRPFEALVNAVGTAQLNGTRVRTVSGSAAISASASGTFNFTVIASGAASIELSAASAAAGILVTSSAPKLSLNATAGVSILGEEWSLAPGSPAPAWTLPIAASNAWNPTTAGSTGNWLPQ